MPTRKAKHEDSLNFFLSSSGQEKPRSQVIARGWRGRQDSRPDGPLDDSPWQQDRPEPDLMGYSRAFRSSAARANQALATQALAETAKAHRQLHKNHWRLLRG